jgi:phosphate starvation-inducible PhoH-like protein
MQSFMTKPSRYIHTANTICMSKKKYVEKAIAPLYSPRTENQKTYVNCLQDHRTKIVLGVGPAGSGKTLFACNVAVEELRKGAIQKIILTRPAVTVEEELGFLPGTLIKKMDPWTRPLFDILLEFYSQKDIDSMLHGGTIEISPLAYMRGRTFKRAFIIADEMQNSSPNQMVMLTTRIGEQSKMVITGDLFQSDRGPYNGLADFLNKLKKCDTEIAEKEPGIRFVELENEDIQRSPIVSKIVDIYNPKPSKESEKIKPTIKTAIVDSKEDAAMIPLSQNGKRMPK